MNTFQRKYAWRGMARRIGLAGLIAMMSLQPLSVRAQGCQVIPTVDPPFPAYICAGDSALATVCANTGWPNTVEECPNTHWTWDYAVEFSQDNSTWSPSDGYDLDWTTNANCYSVTFTPQAQDTGYYRVAVTVTFNRDLDDGASLCYDCDGVSGNVVLTTTAVGVDILNSPIFLLCPGGSVTWTAHSTPTILSFPSGSPTWDIQYPSGVTCAGCFVGTAGSITATFSPSATFSGLATITASCGSSSKSDLVLVSDVATVTASSTAICVGDTATLTATATGAFPSGSPVWSIDCTDCGFVGTDGSTTATFTPPTTYTGTATITAKCPSGSPRTVGVTARKTIIAGPSKFRVFCALENAPSTFSAQTDPTAPVGTTYLWEDVTSGPSKITVGSLGYNHATFNPSSDAGHVSTSPTDTVDVKVTVTFPSGNQCIATHSFLIVKPASINPLGAPVLTADFLFKVKYVQTYQVLDNLSNPWSAGLTMVEDLSHCDPGVFGCAGVTTGITSTDGNGKFTDAYGIKTSSSYTAFQFDQKITGDCATLTHHVALDVGPPESCLITP